MDRYVYALRSANRKGLPGNKRVAVRRKYESDKSAMVLTWSVYFSADP
jgi:hypothetical protein